MVGEMRQIIYALILTVSMTSCVMISAPISISIPDSSSISTPFPPSPTPSPIPSIPPAPSTIPIIDNTCKVYRTISWAVPFIERLLGSNKLTPQQQQLLFDAKTLLDAGCQGNETTWQHRAARIAEELVILLYQN